MPALATALTLQECLTSTLIHYKRVNQFFVLKSRSGLSLNQIIRLRSKKITHLDGERDI